MYKGQISVGIISFNRPDYLKRLVDSLKENDLTNTVFYLFQDGAVNKFNRERYAEDKDIERAMEVFDNAKLPGPSRAVFKQKDNVGIAINQFGAVEYLTNKTDYCIILECDQVVSPYYLRVMRVLAEQFLNNDFIFSVSSGHRKLCKEQDIEKNIDVVKLTRGHWWGELFRAKGWRKIRPYFMKYYNLIKHTAYLDRPREDILDLWEELGAGEFKTTGQDAAKGVACHAAGMGRIRPMVNRAINIGEHGWNFTPGNDKTPEYLNQAPYIFKEDKKITEFKLRI